LDLRKIKKLIDLLEASNLSELEIREGEETVRLARHPRVAEVSYVAAPPSAYAPHAALPSASEPRAADPAPSVSGITVRAPMVGTFYASRTPGSAPFVSEGQSVKVGDTLGIIEAMKMFNPIESEHAGVIKRVLIENGQPVEFDQALFVIE
jgi:acetyl-CoA carboxylase biotin carboxyl carrier protein